MAACYAELSPGDTCYVPSGWSESFSSDLVMDKNGAGFVFLGSATITLGTNQIIIPAGAVAPFMIGQSVQGAITGSNAGAQLIYTGDSAAILIGAAAPASQATRPRLENIYVNLKGAGSEAIGVDMVNVNVFDLKGLMVNGSGGINNQVGLVCDGGGGVGFTGDGIGTNLYVANTRVGIQGLNACIENTFLMTVTSGTSMAGSIGVDLEGISFANTFSGGVLNAYVTGVNYGGSASANAVKISINTAAVDVAHSAGTANNWTMPLNAAIAPGNLPPVFTDAGTGNMVVAPGGAVLHGPQTLIDRQGPRAPETGTGSAVTLYKTMIPANRIAAGKGFRVHFQYRHSTGVASVIYTLKLGPNTIQSFNSADVVLDDMVYEIFNNAGVQNAQTISANTFVNSHRATAEFTTTTDMSEAESLTLTATFPDADQVTPVQWTVEAIQ
jgi:hypothetical protein